MRGHPHQSTKSTDTTTDTGFHESILFESLDAEVLRPHATVAREWDGPRPVSSSNRCSTRSVTRLQTILTNSQSPKTPNDNPARAYLRYFCYFCQNSRRSPMNPIREGLCSWPVPVQRFLREKNALTCAFNQHIEGLNCDVWDSDLWRKGRRKIWWLVKPSS